MKVTDRCFEVLLLGWLTVGCNNPNISRQPVPPADKLQAADCQVAQRELERAQLEAEREAERYQSALQKAQRDAEKAQGDKLNKLNAEIERLFRTL